MIKRYALAALPITALLLVAGCSGNTQVGNASLLKGATGSGGNLGGQPTTTLASAPGATPTHRPSAPTTAAPPVTVHTATTVATHTSAAPTGPQVAIHISINGDNADMPAFDPSVAAIYTGTCAEWTNDDRVARSVIADAGSFHSPSLAPGATWTYCGTTTGSFTYHDGTRPYAVATLNVEAR